VEPQPTPRILPLPAEVVDRIAAGEVIERPASVVRELLENALDAGACAIRVEVREGGLRLIRVADDGHGIADDELALACQPHTTSKVRTLRDLDAIATLGFRGEALASIAAAAEMELTSATDESGLARSLMVKPGGEVAVTAGSRPRGTTVAVRELFQSLPARRAMFARTGVETAKIFATLRAYALMYPAVRFTFVVDGNLLAQTPGHDLAGAVGALYGADAAREMALLGNRDSEGFTLSGAVGSRAFTFSARQHIVLAINGRPVHHRALLAAAEAGYRPLLRKGRHPLLVAQLRLSPEHVDANIHPAKAEVLVRDEQRLAAALRDAVADVLGRTASAPAASGHVTIGAPPAAQPLTLRFPPARRRRGLHLAERRERYSDLWRELADAPVEARDLPDLALAQFDETLILARSSAGDLFLADQHRAHERVLYERLRAQYAIGSAATAIVGGPTEGAARIADRSSGMTAPAQLLLEPLLIELTQRQTQLLTPRLSELAALGVECQPFGGSTFLVRSLPQVPGAAPTAPADTRTLLIEAAEDVEDWRDHVAIALACRSAVRRGQPLSAAEQQTLLMELREVNAPVVCPHGSPLLVRLSRDWLVHAFAW
jgi:DNA mismatch repair protein MutL